MTSSTTYIIKIDFDVLKVLLFNFTHSLLTLNHRLFYPSQSITFSLENLQLLDEKQYVTIWSVRMKRSKLYAITQNVSFQLCIVSALSALLYYSAFILRFVQFNSEGNIVDSRESKHWNGSRLVSKLIEIVCWFLSNSIFDKYAILHVQFVAFSTDVQEAYNRNSVKLSFKLY